MNADCIWRSICIQHVQIEAGLNSDPGNDSFWDKSVIGGNVTGRPANRAGARSTLKIVDRRKMTAEEEKFALVVVVVVVAVKEE